MKASLLVLTLGLTSNALAFNPDTVADKINELVTELFMHDANVSYKQGDYKSAHDKFLWLAKKENPGAQYGLGTIYEDGRGVPQDYKQAVEWYRLSARQGYTMAQLRLARLYFYGKGVSEDYIMAYVWSSLAAAQGDDIGRKNRDRIGKIMAPEQIVVAQALVQQWVLKYNKK
ncbi:MAG: tetratricopeptide repeat protein [Arenicellales bacterium]|nr:tetratricopeptide repeat protein [Arenicellales bacterium]